MRDRAVIIGAGPAGLTAGFELLEKTDIKPIILESSAEVGGISKTVNYKGNCIDIGGHRFFSKSDWVMQWWQKFMPVQGAPSIDYKVLGKEFTPPPGTSPAPQNDPEKSDKVMLIRSRLSRIYFLGKFFDYPISLSRSTLRNLGLVRLIKIGFSYVYARLFPIKREKSLEDFFINRFGRELYKTFFKDYTEKVWGIPCDRINPEWGAQRIKGLSVTKAILHSLKKVTVKKTDQSLSQKETETSLIDKFMYPKYGPGQLWSEVARIIQEKGGDIAFKSNVAGIKWSGNSIISAVIEKEGGETEEISGDWFFSSMPIKDLIRAMGDGVPARVREVSEGLVYRDFITVGLLLDRLKIKNETGIKTVDGLIPDNWIYIQEREVRLSRLQIFNNWSPYLVRERGKVWLGLEYLCAEGDDLWARPDGEIIALGMEELESIGIIRKEYVSDSTVIRIKKAYPAYFGTYEDLGVVRQFLDGFENLFLVGRNGIHRYNNQDHSMLTAKTAVENIVNGIKDKDNIWAVNSEDDYHESKDGGLSK
ncbi:MAG: NAD(P)/FAD-dependent oxidoreductase [Nitrospirota bacterium]